MTTSIMGIAFVAVGFAAMRLMYKLWGYPFDQVTLITAYLGAHYVDKTAP